MCFQCISCIYGKLWNEGCLSACQNKYILFYFYFYCVCCIDAGCGLWGESTINLWVLMCFVVIKSVEKSFHLGRQNFKIYFNFGWNDKSFKQSFYFLKLLEEMVDMFPPFFCIMIRKLIKYLEEQERSGAYKQRISHLVTRLFFHGYHKMSEETEQYSKDLGEINIYI